MFEVTLSTMTAHRVTLPSELVGLDANTLRNLQTALDPVPAQFIGIEYWPAELVETAYDHNTHKIDGETLVVDAERKVVLVSPQAVPLTTEEIAARAAEAARAFNADLDVQIVALEAKITPRRQREALLSGDTSFIAQIDAEIAALRAKRKPV